ncbi:MAG: hypothetical protein IPP14_11005 [Planctomycetes bacterium]|nr:hypothetical protein [Planctomycetota bacterium]
MDVLVECICGRKYQVDPKQVDEFPCEACGRILTVPEPDLSARLDALRQRMAQGEPGMREAMKDAASLHNPHALPLLKAGAESGVREAVNTALCGLCDYPGPGTDLVREWIVQGRLSVSRLASSFRELKFDGGAPFICAMVRDRSLKENQIAEVAGYLGDTGTQEALDTLVAARRDFPNMSSILDDALSKLRHLDKTAGGVPDEAKRIPNSQGRMGVDAEPAKKGCMGLLLVLALVIAAVAAAVLT